MREKRSSAGQREDLNSNANAFAAETSVYFLGSSGAEIALQSCF